VLADVLDFRAEKDRKRRNLGGQADATLTHLKALILIHNNNTSKIKMVPATSLDQPAGPSALTTVVLGRETFFRNLTRRRTEVA